MPNSRKTGHKRKSTYATCGKKPASKAEVDLETCVKRTLSSHSPLARHDKKKNKAIEKAIKERVNVVSDRWQPGFAASGEHAVALLTLQAPDADLYERLCKSTFVKNHFLKIDIPEAEYERLQGIDDVLERAAQQMVTSFHNMKPW